MKFTEFDLAKPFLDAVVASGFEEATPIQAQTIPLALEGKDVIGQAQTGTGKTAAFGLPVLQHTDTTEPKVQTLIISPTRELAIQTQEELYRLSRGTKIKSMVVYGGADIGRQIKRLKDHPQIVVGTPGRLLDHIRRKTLRLDHVKTLVLDEADEMLNMGFLEDIEAIIKEIPNERQTLLFSATMPDDIKRIGVQFMKNPVHVKIKAKEMTADLIDQYYIKCKEFEKFDVMTRLIDVQAPELTIVFGRTKRRVDELSRGLNMRGYSAAGIHGDLPQKKRMQILRDFKAGHIDILVATDVAARGLDISGVTHVYNYDIPQDPDSYVHRIGRTGRAGHEGKSITFVTQNEMEYLKVIENLIRKRMTPMKPPTSNEAFRGQLDMAVEQVAELVEKTNPERYQKTAGYLAEKYDAEELATVLLKLLAKDPEEIKVKITPERPLPSHKKRNNQRSYNRKSGNSRGGKSRNSGNRNNRSYNKGSNDSNYKKSNKSSKGSTSSNKSSQQSSFKVRKRSN